MSNNLDINCTFTDIKIPTPKEIVAYLDQHIVGQDAAKRRLAVAVYNHYKRIHANCFGVGDEGPFSGVKISKSNILMLGGTGTGKTFLIQNIAEFLGVPLYIQDCSKLTAEGYYGGDIEDILTGLVRVSHNNIADAQVGIVCLDEIDKNAVKDCSNSKSGRDINGESVQQGLLKMIEGTKMSLDSKHAKMRGDDGFFIDTSNILFIGTGAFVGMEDIVQNRLDESGYNSDQENVDLLDHVIPEDFIKFGFIPEFVGRFPVITHTNALNVFDLARIVSEPRDSILNQYRKLAYIDNVNLSFTEDAILTVAQEAQASGTGARGIRGILETVLNDFMFECGDKDSPLFNNAQSDPPVKKTATTKSTSRSTSSRSTSSKTKRPTKKIDFVVDRDYCIRALHPDTCHTHIPTQLSTQAS